MVGVETSLLPFLRTKKTSTNVLKSNKAKLDNCFKKRVCQKKEKGPQFSNLDSKYRKLKQKSRRLRFDLKNG